MMKICIWMMIVYLSSTAINAAPTYTVSVKRVNGGNPILDSRSGGDIYRYNYNAAYLPLFNDATTKDALLVRCQNATAEQPYSVGQSVLGASLLQDPIDEDDVIASPIQEKEIVFEPQGPNEAYGTEDPRIVFRSSDKTYYLLYSAVQNDPIVPRLALATTTTPLNISSWVRHGALFPEIKSSKSGAMLIRDGFAGPHYLFWGDSSLQNGLTIATSSDLISWSNLPGIFLPMRQDSFDSALVEAGPMPLPLSDGNYLFIYNSARHGYPSVKPGWDLQYNVGFAILNGTDPTQMIQRSDEPILSPELPWEIGTEPYLGLTPNVVFLQGWKPLGNDTFLAFYGAADSVLGVAIISVSISN